MASLPRSPSVSSPTTARTSSPGPASATGEQDDGGSLPGWTWIALALIGAGVRSLTSRRGRPGGAE